MASYNSNQPQGQLILPGGLVPEKPQDTYTWSTIRVAEGVAVNVFSAIILAGLTLITTVTPATILLYIQNTSQLLLIPTYWLALFVSINLAIFTTLFFCRNYSLLKSILDIYNCTKIVYSCRRTI